MALEIAYIEPQNGFGLYLFNGFEVLLGINTVEEYIAMATLEDMDLIRDQELETHIAEQMRNQCCGTIVALTSKSSGLSCVVAVHKH